MLTMPVTTISKVEPFSCPASPAPSLTDQVQASTSSTPLAHPDSTHQPYTAPFTEGEDILLHDQDGLIYFGIVVEVDHELGQCLVRFGDSTEKWANFFDLRRLETDETDPESTPLVKQESRPVTLIEQFHQELSKELLDPPWQEGPDEEVEREIKLPGHVIAARSKLNYGWEDLVWDESHQVNQTDTYCYCGQSGDWYKRMLQCQDCLQWFHQECIRSLSYQLMFGDRFFKFTCTLCNGKEEETIQRLELGVVDALHLVILNLILSKNQKFHDIETSIIPLIKKKLKYLSDNGTIAHVKFSMITSDHIIKILSNNKTRFKCGSETGQQSCFWGLRRMVAPWLPSKHLLYRPKYCKVSSSIKRLKETLIQPNNKKGQFHGKKPQSRSLGLNKPALKNVMNVSKKSSLKRGRPKDLTKDFSYSDTTSFGTLDLLIKPLKDFSGANNPFRLSSDSFKRSGISSAPSSSSAPASSDPGASLKFLTTSEKESPLSSSTPSQHSSEECRKELLESVAERLKESSEGSRENTKDSTDNESEDDKERPAVFKIPSLITSYFAPTAKTRIAGGNAFGVKARRLTLNGDIAYLINWEPNTIFKP